MKLTLIADLSEIKFDKKGRHIHHGLMLFNYLLDHSLLYKKDIIYDEEKKILNLYLKRNDFSPILRKMSIFSTWTREKFKKIDCKLSINNVIKYLINDDVLFDKADEEIIIGGITFDEEGLYIGSWCLYERGFEIIIEVDKIFISLEDINLNV